MSKDGYLHPSGDDTFENSTEPRLRARIAELEKEADKWAAAYRDAKQDAQRVTAELTQQLEAAKSLMRGAVDECGHAYVDMAIDRMANWLEENKCS